MTERNILGASILPYLNSVSPAKPRYRGGHTVSTYAKDVPEGYFDEVIAVGGGWHRCIKHYPAGPIRVELPPAAYHNTCIEMYDTTPYIPTGRAKQDDLANHAGVKFKALYQRRLTEDEMDRLSDTGELP
jgi:hypothetical protein